MKVKKTQFKEGQIYGAQDGSLGDIIVKLAQDNARVKLAALSDLTDNSTGTSAGTLAAQAGGNIARGTLSGTNLAPKAGFDTAVGKIKNAISTLIAQINVGFTPLGLPLITDSTGGTSGAGTIAALDKALTAVNASAVDAVSGAASLEAIRNALIQVKGYANQLAYAAGRAEIGGLINATEKGKFLNNRIVAAIPASGTAVAGTVTNSSILDADMDVELSVIANNIASLATFLNGITGTAAGALQVVAAK